jgi:hypothetical protein
MVALFLSYYSLLKLTNMLRNLEDKLKEIADKLCTPKNEILYNVTLEES